MLHATLLDFLFSVGCSGSKHAIRLDSQESYFKLSGSAKCTDLLKYIFFFSRHAPVWTRLNLIVVLVCSTVFLL